jgi:FKBP-type peptidyl-prolyl cis-trans isomerase
MKGTEMRVFCLGALGLGLYVGLLAAAEPGSNKSKDDPKVDTKANGGVEAAADDETGREEKKPSAKSARSADDDEDESKSGDDKPAKDDKPAADLTKKPALRGLAAKDQELIKKANYMVAADWAQGLWLEGFEFDLDEMIRGVKDVLAERATTFTPEEKKECIIVMQQRMVDNRDKKSRKFLEDNKNKEGVVTTKTGLQYKVLKSGKGASPKAADMVTVHYKGSFTDGVEFDSSYRHNMPVTFAVNKMIKGWTEALQLMKVGDKWQLFVPGDLAYGAEGRKDQSGRYVIPPKATLVFEVELLSIQASQDE